eukprot:1956716-Amphidinium_carterae.1
MQHTTKGIKRRNYKHFTELGTQPVERFNQWRDELFNYKETTKQILDNALKTTVRAHLLLKTGLNTSDCNKAVKDRRNVYSDNVYNYVKDKGKNPYHNTGTYGSYKSREYNTTGKCKNKGKSKGTYDNNYSDYTK